MWIIKWSELGHDELNRIGVADREVWFNDKHRMMWWLLGHKMYVLGNEVLTEGGHGADLLGAIMRVIEDPDREGD